MVTYNYRSSIIFGFGGINFYSNIDIYSYLLSSTITKEHADIKILNYHVSTEFKVYYKDSNVEKSIKYCGNKLFIVYPFDGLYNNKILIFAISPFIELQRQSNKMITCHASTLNINSAGILLFGNIGAGKTSLAIKLCMDYDAKLIGNDISVIRINAEDIILDTGIKDFILRYESMRRNIPNIIDLFPINPEEMWRCKIQVNSADLGIIASIEKPICKNIYFVHVNEDLQSVFVKQDDCLNTKLILLENFSRYIRGTAIGLFECNGELIKQPPSYDSVELCVFRKNVINMISKRVFYISGPINMVAKYIYEEANKNDTR